MQNAKVEPTNPRIYMAVSCIIQDLWQKLWLEFTISYLAIDCKYLQCVKNPYFPMQVTSFPANLLTMQNKYIFSSFWFLVDFGGFWELFVNEGNAGFNRELIWISTSSLFPEFLSSSFIDCKKSWKCNFFLNILQGDEKPCLYKILILSTLPRYRKRYKML